MEPINLVFFALATLFGNTDSRVVCNRVLVNITPAQKTIEIIQENIFSVYISEEDSLAVASELKTLAQLQKNPLGIVEGFSVVKFNMSVGADNKLNATIVLKYDDAMKLKGFGIDSTEEGYYLPSVPAWEIQSTVVPKDNFLLFPPLKPFHFSMQPFLNMPAEYKDKKTELAKQWSVLSSQ